MVRRPIIIAHHLIFTGYGHWLPNDPRGSGSKTTREPKLADLGDLHFGRKRVQPTRHELREFMNEAQRRLTYSPIWFDQAKRQAVADGFAQAAADNRYTVWACAILRNHAHLCVRRHRDDGGTIWREVAERSAQSIRAAGDVDEKHPIWSFRPYKRFLDTPEAVWRVVRYIQENPRKENLLAQSWKFVTPYDGWPYRARGSKN